VADFQRWANDMMAVTSDPQGYSQDMAYHYHKIWKVMSPSKTRCGEGNGAILAAKVHPK
jgi:hypothetical protein